MSLIAMNFTCGVVDSVTASKTKPLAKILQWFTNMMQAIALKYKLCSLLMLDLIEDGSLNIQY